MQSYIQFHAAAYIRMSKNEQDYNSITNQENLIRNYLKSHFEIKLETIYIDNGFTGIHFERPSFQSMMNDIKKGKINCIIVKDLSRFGRNYIEIGNYLERIFPFIGVRFIAINDGYDSSMKNKNDQLFIPIKNLMNEIYSYDISLKVKTNLEAKKRKGDFASAFTPYGYKKSSENKNKLVIDEEAAHIVHKIFLLKLEGKSNFQILDYLNSNKILCPSEYKKKMGLNYSSGFQTAPETKWSIKTILSILKNEVYIGNLEQGKRIRINYKMKKQILKNKQDWIKVENTHEPIVSKEDFLIVQELLLMDTRQAADKKDIYMFSGFLECADCKNSLTRRIVYSNKKKYIYYTCRQSNGRINCSHINIREDDLEKAVFETLRIYIGVLTEKLNLFKVIETAFLNQAQMTDIEKKIELKKNTITRYQTFKDSIYKDLYSGLLCKEEYLQLKSRYLFKERKEIENLDILLKEKMLNNYKKKQLLMNFSYLSTLERKVVIRFIKKIIVYDKNNIEICFRSKNELEKTASFHSSIISEK